MADLLLSAAGRGAVALSAMDLLIAASLVLAAGAVSIALGLGLERRLVVAAARTVLQLLLVGYLLVWIFKENSPWLVVVALLLMTFAAGRAAVDRSRRSFRGVFLQAFLTLLLTGALTTGVVTQVVIGVTPWYQPQYLIPLLGMVLGNSLTGISLCLDDLLEALDERRDRIEMALALGATSWEAARDVLRAAVRRGMIPIINAMTVAGIVSLPGMMTGQILAGSDPARAVAYQIVVMFMLAGATALGCMLTALLVFRRLFSPRHQLLVDHIRRREK